MMHRQRGQVLIEFAMAAVGLVAIAFVTARVAQWINQSMVERNDHFQGTRDQAGQGAGLVRFNGPNGRINLLGPSAASTSVQPSPGAGPSAAPPGCPGGADKFIQAANLRSQAYTQITSGNTELSGNITRLQNEAKFLIGLANNALAAANTVNNRLNSIATLNARLNYIHHLQRVQDIGGINGIDERLAVLAGQIDHINNDILPPINSRIDTRTWEINQLLYVDADGPGPVTQGLQTIMDATCNAVLATDPTNAICAPIRDARDALLSELSGATGELKNLYDLQTYWQGQLTPLQNEQSFLQPLLDEREAKRGTSSTPPPTNKRSLLNQVDGIISAWQGTLHSPNLGWDFWNHIPTLPSMASFDLSDLYDQMLAEWGAPNSAHGEPGQNEGGGHPNLRTLLGRIRDRFNQLAVQLATEALNRYNQANALIDVNTSRSQAAQWLIEAAENLEREARSICSSLPN